MTKFQTIRICFVLVLLSVTGMVYFSLIPWWTLTMVVVGYAGLMFYFSMNIQANFFLKAVHQMPNDKVMLTFDDGPDPECTPRILKVLKKNDVKAFFFLIGGKAEKHPELVERIVAEGHQIGGHSYHHVKWFGLMGQHKTSEEIMSAQRVLAEIAGQPVKFFRPPFGVTNPNVAKCVDQNELKTIGWNVRSFDTAISDNGLLEKRVCAQMDAGSIVLMHDRLPQTVEVLPGIITHAKQKGLEFDVL